MINWEDLIKEIDNDEKALMLLSYFGFLAPDIQAIKKLGGPLNLIKSDLLLTLHKKFENQKQSLQSLLKTFKYFSNTNSQYVKLISILENKQCRLFRSKCAPLLFWFRYENPFCTNVPYVAIVGSRRATDAACGFTRNLAHQLSQSGIFVVSGGASGIDTAAHLGALDAKKMSVLVSGMRLSMDDDSRRAPIRKIPFDLLSIIYPYAPWHFQSRSLFAMRNEYMVLLADALVVVEGEENSGTLHSVAYAKSHNVPIFAIPGPINNPLSFVPNKLIEENEARALINPEKLISFLKKRKISNKKIKEKNDKPSKKQSFNKELPYILKLIKENDNALTMDELIALSGSNFNDLRNELFDYELSGRIFKRGGQFVLTGN